MILKSWLSSVTYAGIVLGELTYMIEQKVTVFSHPFRNLLENGSTYVGLNAALCGLIANSLFRRILHVTQARIAAGLPMAVIPFLTANASYKGFVSLPLSTGKFYFTITSKFTLVYSLYLMSILKVAIWFKVVTAYVCQTLMDKTEPC